MNAIKSFLALAFFFTCSLTFAQPPGGGQGGQPGPPSIPGDKQIEKMVSDLSDELNMNNEQEVRILELYKAHFEQVKENTSANSRPKREEMETMKSAFEKMVKSELTNEQNSKYEAYLKKQEKRRPRR